MADVRDGRLAPEGPQPFAVNASAPADCLAGGGNMGARMRAFDWAATPLGPVDGWPQSLRTAVSIVLASGFPMLVLWGDEFIQLYNDAYRPVLGATKHPAALGQRARDCWPEIWDDVLGPMFRHVMDGGEPIWSKDLLFVLDRNGYLEETYFTFSYSAIRDESGRPGGILVTCVETTDQIIGERRLRTLRELAAHASSSGSVADTCRLAVDTLAGNPQDLPFALLYLVDGDRARLCGRSGIVADHAAAPPVIPAELDEPWPVNRVAATAELAIAPDLVRRLGRLSDGPWPEPVDAAVMVPIGPPGLKPAIGTLVVGVSPRLALDSNYRGFLDLVAGQIANALQNARAREAERERAEALAAIDRAKTVFFSNISHEFRTPLTLLLGPTEDALASPRQALEGEALLSAYRNELRLLKLVNTLLDFARIESGRARAAYRRTDIAALTRDLASAFRSVVEQAGLTFEVHCGHIASPVFVDREMWEKIVLNLLSNAFKFTFEGRIGVQLRQSGNDVELRVSDTGTGIPADQLSHIFERFHRVQGTRSRSYEGSGIGLALVRDLVDMHQGTIDVESRAGEGTTFTVRIPTGAAHLPPDHVVHEEGSADIAAASPFVEEARRWLPDIPAAPAPPDDGPSPGAALPSDRTVDILIVDDNRDMRDYLRRLLEPHWRITCVEDGDAALAAVAVDRPDLVITDVMMSGCDGFELLRRLRAAVATRTIPVIMLSARAGEEARIEGLSAGADDYLIKPFSARELVARVATQIELVRLRARAAQEHERLLTTFHLAPAAIAVVRGPEHVFELANDRYFALVGRSDIVGKAGRQALPELTDQGIWELFDRVYASGEPYVAREFAANLDRLGTGQLDRGFFDLALQPLKDPYGTVEGLLIHVIEVTDKVLAQRSIDEARRAAETANRTKDEFLAMLGHELRNPLAPILTALQLMNLRGDKSAVRERGVIERQVRHLVRLVDDLLDVSRIARGKIELRNEDVEMAVVVARAIEMASPLLEERQQNLHVDVPRTGLSVTGDPTRLAQVVMNLLTNAAKYTEPHGRIEVGAARTGGEIELRVKDNGIGISAEMLPKIFDLFAQEQQTYDRSRGGLGLGLTIVRSLVELHGGMVEARSEGLGRGTEFVVRIPARVGDRRFARQRAAAMNGSQAGRRILIVDDNTDAALLLADALSENGHETAVAHDAPSALALAIDFKPDVALLDLGLPVMDGYELAGKLKNLDMAPRLVALTGYGLDSDRRRSRAAGFDAHVVKPIDLDGLHSVLDGLFGDPRIETADRS